MATNKFLIFDENGSNLMTDSEYQAASQRIGGVIPGLAEPEMHNKLYRQTSIMAAAIGRVLAGEGYDAPDDNVQTLANNIRDLFCFNVLTAYPVGSIYISASAVSPAQLFGGTWEQIQGKFLIGASATYAPGTTGGEETHTLTKEEMPTHTHLASISNAGEHSHGGVVSEAGGHTHTRGTMNITGDIGDFNCGHAPNRASGAFYLSDKVIKNKYNSVLANIDGVGFEAARTWTGETSNNGAHTHTLTASAAGDHLHQATITTAGSGDAHNNMPPYLSVYIWKRTA